MTNMSGFSREEFQYWMELLRSDIQGVQTSLDKLNGRTRTVENKVAVLEANHARDPTARWGAAGAAAAVAIEAIRHYFTKP